MKRLSETIDLNNNYGGEIPSISLFEISVIIPVKNNQKGIDRFLTAFFETQNESRYPREIIIIDNNSIEPIVLKEEFLKNNLEITLLSCTKKGPAAARNKGVDASKGTWLLFSDSDCIPTSTFLTGYLNCKRAVAYAGNVKATPHNLLTNFYDDEETLLPNRKYNKIGFPVPLYIVTANALVWKWAFGKCGGFNDYFNNAGGEDVDLARRLWQIGNIEYEPNSVVLHDFSDGIVGFCNRFIRYGRGNWQFQEATDVDMVPRMGRPKKVSIFNYVARFGQYILNCIGYYTEKNSTRLHGDRNCK